MEHYERLPSLARLCPNAQDGWLPACTQQVYTQRQVDMSLPRSSFIPEGAVQVQGLDAKVGAIYTYTDKRGRSCAVAFKGKASAPTWSFYFTTVEQRDARIKHTLAAWNAHQQTKANNRTERKEFEHTFKPGDLLYSSWGYDQTNIDYYQVVSTTAKSVAVRKIESIHTRPGSGNMDGYCKPAPGMFISAPRTHRVRPGNSIKITSFSYARQCTADSEHHWSSWH
jgi:hypothetical protein